MENDKRLERDMQHKVIGGVCSRLANYFGIDSTLLRLILAFMLVFAGAGFWLYIILWIVIPAGVPGAETIETGQSVMETPEGSRTTRGSLVFGLILIALGALGLLYRFIPAFNWQTIWPVILIVLGILLLIPFKNKQS